MNGLLPSSQSLLSLLSHIAFHSSMSPHPLTFHLPSKLLDSFFSQSLLHKDRHGQTKFPDHVFSSLLALGERWEMGQEVEYPSNYTFGSLYFFYFLMYKMWE